MQSKIHATIFYAIVLGALFGMSIIALFPISFFSPRYTLPFPEMFKIFILNSFIASVIVFGGIVFSLIEIRFYSHHKVYKTLDKTVNPLYFLLRRISPEYSKLGPLWRSLYLALCFPLICIFLIVFVISLHLTLFVLINSLRGLGFLLKLIPHISIEILVFTYAAKMGLDNSANLGKPIKKKSISSFRKESKRLLKNKKTWKKLIVLYAFLFIAAVTEKIFIGM